MPNHKLGKDLPDRILGQAKSLALRKIEYAAGDFPLTCNDLEQATISDDVRDMMERLVSSGSNQVQRCKSVHMTLQRGHIPDLERTCHLILSLPSGIYTARTQYNNRGSDSNNRTVFDVQGTACLILNLRRLRDEQIEAMSAWANGLVRAHRHREMASHTVRDALSMFPSTGAILANWPLLATLTTDKIWRDRFRSPPVYLDRYKVPVTPARRRDFMAVEGMLLGAQMMQEFKHPEGAVTANLMSFERFDGDRFKNVASTPG